MRRIVKALLTALMTGGALWACSNDPEGPPGAGEEVQSAIVTDPAGDTFGNRGAQWDLTAFTVTRDSTGITVLLRFSSAPLSPASGDSNAMIAFVDFDTDHDSSTGSPTMVDEFRRDGGATGIKGDYRLDLAEYAADSTVLVFDEGGTVTGHVKPVFDDREVRVRIPKAMLGNDDGFLDAAVIVGTEASPTDIAPEQGHLELRE